MVWIFENVIVGQWRLMKIIFIFDIFYTDCSFATWVPVPLVVQLSSDTLALLLGCDSAANLAFSVRFHLCCLIAGSNVSPVIMKVGELTNVKQSFVGEIKIWW